MQNKSNKKNNSKCIKKKTFVGKVMKGKEYFPPKENKHTIYL